MACFSSLGCIVLDEVKQAMAEQRALFEVGEQTNTSVLQETRNLIEQTKRSLEGDFERKNAELATTLRNEVNQKLRDMIFFFITQLLVLAICIFFVVVVTKTNDYDYPVYFYSTSSCRSWSF